MTNQRFKGSFTRQMQMAECAMQERLANDDERLLLLLPCTDRIRGVTMYGESEGGSVRASERSRAKGGGKTSDNNKIYKKAETGSGKEEQIL